MKKFGCILLVFIALFALAWFKPWNTLGLTPTKIIGLEAIQQQAALTVFSLKDSIDIYIDNELKESIDTSGGSAEIVDIKPGMHRITLRKSSETTGEFYEFSQTLNFVKGVSNVVAYELGPTQEFSQGHVFYTEKLNEQLEKGTTYISFLSNMDEIEVYLNNQKVGETPIEDHEITLDKQYDVTLKKEGYEELSFKILPEGESERTKLEGLHLYIKADLFLKPIDIDKVE